MSARLLWVLLLSAGIVFYFSLRSGQGRIAVGQPVPTFSLADAEGQSHTLEAWRGQVVILNFWATNCYTCATEMPALNRLAQHFTGQPVQIVGVSEDAPPVPATDHAAAQAALASVWRGIAAYRQQVPIDFLVVLDPGGEVADRYGTYMIPETYIIDTAGRLVRKVQGAIEWDHPQVLQEISALLQH